MPIPRAAVEKLFVAGAGAGAGGSLCLRTTFLVATIGVPLLTLVFIVVNKKPHGF